MGHDVRGILLPKQQRRTLEELTDDLDLRTGDRRSRYTAFWTMLALSAVIASAGVLSDSTATVIGAMIIAPLSTPIMGTALALAEQRSNGSLRFVFGGIALVVAVGLVFSQLLPSGYDLLENGQIAGRTSPSMLDMIAALATGLAGAVAMARRDVAAVLPGVAIAISLVPPLAVVGICLGQGALELALGASILFISNLLALVLAGTVVYAVLGYAEEAVEKQGGSRRRAYAVLSVLIVVVSVPLAANTLVTYLLTMYADRVQTVADEWIVEQPGATVTGVDVHGLEMTINVETASSLPPVQDLLDALEGEVPEALGFTVHAVRGEAIQVRSPEDGP